MAEPAPPGCSWWRRSHSTRQCPQKNENQLGVLLLVLALPIGRFFVDGLAMPKPYIHGLKNIACCSLIEYLREDLGIAASVGHDNKLKNATLYVYTHHKRDVSRVPCEWDGFTVVASHAGPIKPLLSLDTSS